MGDEKVGRTIPYYLRFIRCSQPAAKADSDSDSSDSDSDDEMTPAAAKVREDWVWRRRG